MTRKHILGLAAVLSLAAAVFQLALGFVPDWSAFFEAPEQLLARPTQLLVASIIVVILFLISATYAASGAGYVRKLPLLRTALLVTGAIFLLRGWIFIPLVLASLGIIHAPVKITGVALGTSAAFLLLAVLYLGGLMANWPLLRPGTGRGAH